MLDAINFDRKDHGLRSVDLSENQCGQLHADNMVSERFFSHWNGMGLRPLARYNSLGGHAYIMENVGVGFWSLGVYDGKKKFGQKQNDGVPDRKVDPAQIISNIRQLEFNFMYNDEEHGNHHRDNILDRYHNKISLGISLEQVVFHGDVYQIIAVVQDFENYFTRTTVTENREGIDFQGEKSPKLSISYGLILGSEYEAAPVWTSKSGTLLEMDKRQSYDDGKPITSMARNNVMISINGGQALSNIPIEIKDSGKTYKAFIERPAMQKYIEKNKYYTLLLYDKNYSFPVASHTLFM